MLTRHDQGIAKLWCHQRIRRVDPQQRAGAHPTRLGHWHHLV